MHRPRRVPLLHTALRLPPDQDRVIDPRLDVTPGQHVVVELSEPGQDVLLQRVRVGPRRRAIELERLRLHPQLRVFPNAHPRCRLDGPLLLAEHLLASAFRLVHARGLDHPIDLLPPSRPRDPSAEARTSFSRNSTRTSATSGASPSATATRSRSTPRARPSAPATPWFSAATTAASWTWAPDRWTAHSATTSSSAHSDSSRPRTAHPPSAHVSAGRPPSWSFGTDPARAGRTAGTSSCGPPSTSAATMATSFLFRGYAVRPGMRSIHEYVTGSPHAARQLCLYSNEAG